VISRSALPLAGSGAHRPKRSKSKRNRAGLQNFPMKQQAVPVKQGPRGLFSRAQFVQIVEGWVRINVLGEIRSHGWAAPNRLQLRAPQIAQRRPIDGAPSPGRPVDWWWREVMAWW